MRAIAADVDISPALLQYYFPSREELLLAVIQEWDDENNRRSLGWSVFGGWLRSIRHNSIVPGLVHLYTTSLAEATDPEHPGRSFFEKRYTRFTRNTVAEVLLQQHAGVTREDLDPERIARILLALSEGLQIRWLHTPDFDMAKEFKYLLDLLELKAPEIDLGELDLDADPANDEPRV